MAMIAMVRDALIHGRQVLVQADETSDMPPRDLIARPRRASEACFGTLGHSGVAITLDTYSHVLPGLQEQAANLLDGYLKKPISKVG